jgi:hypothetical protein
VNIGERLQESAYDKVAATVVDTWRNLVDTPYQRIRLSLKSLEQSLFRVEDRLEGLAALSGSFSKRTLLVALLVTVLSFSLNVANICIG